MNTTNFDGLALQEITTEESSQINGGATAIGGGSHEGENLSDYSFWYRYQSALIFGSISAR